MLDRFLTHVTCALLLAGSIATVSGTSAAAAEVSFDRYDVVTGSAKRQTVLTGFLLGGAMAELAVVHIDENKGRRLRIYAFEGGTWAPKLEATLRPDVSFVDVASIGGRDRLFTYERGRLSWFDPESKRERALVAVTSSFNPPRRSEIPHVDVSHDVNGDDRDDLVVPDTDGFWVFTQTEGGAFADPVKIGPAIDMSGIYGADGYRYDPWSQSRVHEMDYNQDGRSDLVSWNEDHFEVHLQDERGLFAPEVQTFTTDVAFDSDDPYSLATGEMTGRVLHSFTDLNGDGVADLVVFSLEGTSISSKKSTYEVYFGGPAPDGGTVFSRDVGKAFQSKGSIQLGLVPHDFDRDGQVDLMFTSIAAGYLERSFFKRLGRWVGGQSMSFGVMGDDVWLRLEFYRSEDGRYPDKPSFTRRLALDGPPSNREPGWVPLEIALRGGTHESRKTQEIWPRAFNATLRIGDVTGDGRSDLLIADHPRIMVVHSGVPGRDLFGPRAHEVKLPIPNDEEFIWLIDLNKDGKQDILMHHPFTLRDGHGAPTQPPGTESHRLTLLIAR